MQPKFVKIGAMYVRLDMIVTYYENPEDRNKTIMVLVDRQCYVINLLVEHVDIIVQSASKLVGSTR